MKKKLRTKNGPVLSARLICTGLLLIGLLPATLLAGNSNALASSKSTLANARINITGTVKDSKGEPLPGVSVKIKSSKSGTSTDINGIFRLNLPTGNETLVFSFIGYETQEIALNGRTTLNVSLKESSKGLDEVVVVGYGTQKKSSLTGAVSTVALKKVQDVPVLSVTAALRGTVPGLSVSGGTQRPGQGTTITIRNPVAFAKDGGQGTNPLFVIDDIIRTQTDFDLLDPAEIETVSVLKDAEAAVYGVQGANGVIIVRTKKGRMGAPKISLSSSLGASDATMLPKMMNSLQLGTYVNDYYQGNVFQQTTPGVPVNKYYNEDGFLVNADAGTTETTRYANWYTPDELEYFSTHSHNYLEEAFKTAYVGRVAVNVEGGSDKVNYFIGGDYVNQNSNFEGVNSYKYGLRANVEAKPTDRLTVSLSLSTNVGYSRSYWYKLKSTTESLDNDVTSLENVQPWQEYFIDGNPVLMGGSTSGGYDNLNFFLVQKSNNYTGGSSNATNILGKLNYKVPGIKGLEANFTVNKNINSANNKQFGTSFTYYKYSGQGANGHIPGGTIQNTYVVSNGDKVRLSPTFANSYQIDAGLNYNRTFGKHSITMLALFEQREQNSEGVAAEATGVVTGGLDYQTFTTGTQSSSQSSMVSQFGFQAFISRLNYSYADKYLLQLVYRADGSSRFASGRNWGGFPSASLGWVASEEPFIKNNFPAINQLKFRVSAGLTGTDNTKPYQYAASYNLGTGSSGGAVFNEGDRSTAIKTNVAIPNTQVTWDHVFKTDYGMDVQFLNNRLSFTGDYFWSHGYKMLTTLSSSVPVTIGASVPTENYSTVNMFGFELTAGWRDHIGKKFTYEFTPFYSWMDNKNIKIDVASGDVGGPLDLTGKSSDVGVYGYKSLGIIRTQADADAIIAERAAAAGDGTKVKIFGTALQPGMINYQDYNGDGIIDANDRQYLTKRQSNHNSLGLNFGAGYGSLHLDVIMGMSWGGWLTIDGQKPANQSSSSTGASIADNRPVYWVDHWTPTNTNAKYPAPYFVGDYNVTTDFWLVRATTLNITSATLNYSLPSKLISKVGLSSVRVYAVTTNPIQFINPFPKKYRDIQTSLYSYPSLRTVSLGLNVGF